MTTVGYLTLILIGLASVGSLGLLLRHHRHLPDYLTAHDKSLVHIRWNAIEDRLKKGGPTQLRQAVIEADTLVDYALKQLKVEGDTMGERLRASEKRYSDYDGLWKAHKLRNQIVHEVDREVLSFEAKQMVEKFRIALTDLGAL